ncbi:helix-turn-helix domain-containing protein [Microseira wollei]|uniref:Transposase n=1 Tax=Microseira wollei NIES-4236 TaxID=2530354 RepID=A0AAV3XQX6_9CYAN|nr:helix-turn-helix domain-containing protein [Microseira wollei]GET44420.1 putative transposase [Microseira wollei NIES-4236]
MLKAVKVRIYPTDEQQSHLAQAFGCVRWVWVRFVPAKMESSKG